MKSQGIILRNVTNMVCNKIANNTSKHKGRKMMTERRHLLGRVVREGVGRVHGHNTHPLPSERRHHSTALYSIIHTAIFSSQLNG